MFFCPQPALLEHGLEPFRIRPYTDVPCLEEEVVLLPPLLLASRDQEKGLKDAAMDISDDTDVQYPFLRITAEWSGGALMRDPRRPPERDGDHIPEKAS